MRETLISFLRDERGQDLIEYALLTALIGFAGLAAFNIILGAIGTSYASWETQTNNLWVPPEPIGGGS